MKLKRKLALILCMLLLINVLDKPFFIKASENLETDIEFLENSNEVSLDEENLVIDNDKSNNETVVDQNEIIIEEIKLSETTLSLEKGKISTLNATVSPNDATNKELTWTSSNTSFAIVDENGKVTAVAAGSVTITATAKDGSGKTASCTVTITNPIVKVTGINLNKTTLSLEKSKISTLTATVSPSNATNKDLTWTSSNTKVATVDGSGKVTAVGAGSANIIATTKEGSGKTATCKVTVVNPIVKVTGIKLNTNTLSLVKGKTGSLTIIVSPSNATNKGLTWTSSNKKIATVDGNGKVTAVALGTATITVTTKDGSKKTASFKVTVTNPVKVNGIKLNKASLIIEKGKTGSLTITVSPSNASNKGLTWTSSNKKIATVDGNGKVTAVASGTATITATTKDGSKKTASFKVTVINPVKVTSVKLSKTSLSIEKGKTAVLTTAVSPNNATNKGLTWTSSNMKVATVDVNGKVTAVGAGSSTIKATAKDGSGKTASCIITVINPVVKVTSVSLIKTSLSIEKGKTGLLTATVNPSNASNKGLTWTSSNTKVATVDVNGKVTAVAPGTSNITVTAKDGSGKTASCIITVTNPVVKVTSVGLNNTNLSLEKGKTSTLTATVSPSNATNKGLTWTSSNTKVATVDVNGKVTAISLGSATIIAKSKDGSEKTAECKVQISEKGIVIDISSELSIMEEANESSKIIEKVSNNTIVDVIEQSGNWYKIKYNDLIGYVSSTYINIINISINPTVDSQLYNHEIDLMLRIKSTSSNFDEELNDFKIIYEKNKETYIKISKLTNIPPELIAAIHYRESLCNFKAYFHNGELLGRVTQLEPKGKLFFKFEDSAVDALLEKDYYKEKYNLTSNSKDIIAMCSFAEVYNGLGYYENEKISPYVYSGTNIYEKGKFKYDGVFDANLIDKQPGVYILINKIK